ncbi:MAG: hypothetical protein P8X73_09635 [Ignavibacteriaceae bacterium]
MRYLIYIIFILSLLVGCAGNREVSNKSSQALQKQSIEDPKQKAMEHFLNGTVSEQSGNYQSAILEYQTALQYDTSAGIFYSLAKVYLITNKLSNALNNARLAVKYEPMKTQNQWKQYGFMNS